METKAGDPQAWLDDYCFTEEEVVLVPLEQFSREGVEPSFRERLAALDHLGEDAVALFERAFALYWQRTAELSARTPMYWFPPRVQHVCLVTDDVRVRPYAQPFFKSAWRMVARDFDPRVSNVEFAAFQFVQAERLNLLQDAFPVLPSNLSYWIERTDEEAASFADACRAVDGPAASFWRSLADALPWIRELRHEVLDPPRIASVEPLVTLPRTGLILPRSRQGNVDELLRAWKRCVEGSVRAYYEGHGGRERNHAEEVCAWLREARPRVIVTGKQGATLWDPDEADALDAVRSQLKGITASAAASLRADLEVVGERSQGFVEALARPAELPSPEPGTADQNGLSYMHIERREVAYNLHEDRMQRLREPAAPYERFMLGARTIHEWGHLATSAGWVPVAPDRQDEHAALLEETGVAFAEIIQAAPHAVRNASRASLDRLGRGEPAWGPALARFSLSRVEDFQSNLIAQRFCSQEEVETYVRNNVRSLVHDYGPEGMFHRLARYAYEYQYLRFSCMPDPERFFLAGSWFAEQYLTREVVREENWIRLRDLLGRLCDTYAIDETAFRPC